MANTSKFTPDVRDKILNALRAGCPIDTALAFAGVSKEGFYKWVRRGNKAPPAPHPDHQFRVFVDAVNTVLATVEVHHAGIITTAAKKDWRASAHILERRFPSRWAKQVVDTHIFPQADGGSTGGGGGSPAAGSLSFDDARREIENLIARARDRADARATGKAKPGRAGSDRSGDDGSEAG
jgi:hypothetical protein